MAPTVFITGASSGIGHSSAMLLAEKGFLVFAGVRRPEDAARLERQGRGRVFAIHADVTDETSIRAAVGQVSGRVKGHGLDGLVNNAGIGIAGPIEHMPMDVLRQQFDVNVFGQVAVTQAFLPLIRQARGRIVNMGSVGAHIAIPFGGALCASKAAFRSLNDALRLELRPFGIFVSMIEPGSIHTPAVGKTLGDVDGTISALPPEGAARYADTLRRFMERAQEREEQGSSPDVVAKAVHHALTAKQPHARYPVGKDARLLVTMPRVLSDGMLDRIRYRLFGLPTSAT
jgi:NAD(P)-dependent dehydrogenase (short-subunit alcohol dehydrogenase family)